MKTLFVSSLILLLTACTSLTTRTTSLPEKLAEITSATSLACRFDKQTSNEKSPEKTQRSNWYLWREPQRTETRDELSNQGEMWERNSAGQFFYTRLFYNERVALEFVPGDLAATGVTPSWQQLSSLIDNKMLGKELSLLSKDTINGMAVEYYSGSVNGVATEVDWLPSLQLPARLMKKLPDATVNLSLSECSKEPKFAVKPLTRAEFNNFRRLDYTDLGDMEDDPLVRRLQQIMGEHHHHSGH